MITIVDNYDSFTYNLVQQIERLAGERLRIVRNDAFDPAELIAEKPRAIVISPGPGTPARAGRCIELIRANRETPMLGVCLGHQAIAEAFGATVIRGALPVHGKISEVRHHGARLFADCPAPMHTARYHSLVVDQKTLPDFLVVDAETDDGAIMAISHTERPIFGIQFHPESYGTLGGDRLIVNFLKHANLASARASGRQGPGVVGSDDAEQPRLDGASRQAEARRSTMPGSTSPISCNTHDRVDDRLQPVEAGAAGRGVGGGVQ